MRLESLESRRLFSVTVYEAYPGFYELHGDESDDVINVSVSMKDETFTVDGATYTGAYYIFVNGYGGNDSISVTSVDGSGMIGASISAGDGSDSVSLNFDGAVWGGRGHDQINLADSFRGEVYGEEGNDRMTITGACVNAQILGGDGNDNIDCSGNYYGVVVFAGLGNDTVVGSAYDDQIYAEEGHDKVSGGAGNDTFYVQDGSTDDIDGGAGYDFVYADSDEANMTGVEAVYT
jgi:Ca2+-binding RTX toxin-like protein